MCILQFLILFLSFLRMFFMLLIFYCIFAFFEFACLSAVELDGRWRGPGRQWKEDLVETVMRIDYTNFNSKGKLSREASLLPLLLGNPRALWMQTDFRGGRGPTTLLLSNPSQSLPHVSLVSFTMRSLVKKPIPRRL